MARTMKQAGAAVQYARALLDLANEQKQAEATGEELRELGLIIEGNKSLGSFLSDPGISAGDRTALLNKVFKGKVSQLVMNTMGVLNSKGRLGLLHGITEAYGELLDEQLGKIEVDVTVAQKLGAADLEQVRQRIGQALKKDAIVHQYVDEKIIGGMVLRVDDKLIDASVKHQLETMKRKMLMATPRN
jgi:F-type H+-transporting ATPase subunit delta